MNERHELHGDDLDAMVEVRAGTCKEYCGRASQGHPECESEWDCDDPNVVAQCMERVARERSAEEYNDAVISNGGIHPANVYAAPDPNDYKLPY